MSLGPNPSAGRSSPLAPDDPTPATATEAPSRDTASMRDGAADASVDFTLHGEPIRSPVGHFGKYELMGELGRGGMGVVYKARQKDLERVVALKMILASHLASRDQVARFYAEARAAARLRHPRIVGIHEVGEHGGQHYFAMEYVAGQSLARRIRRDAGLGVEDAARLVADVSRAVHYLHQQKMIHRDLKPSNILIDEAGRPFVTDFGLARAIDPDARMTHSGAIVGTPGYMAPEQAAGRGRTVGPRSDIYSLGAILFEALTGRPPHPGDAPLDALVHVLEGEPPRPRALNDAIPRPLERICLKALERQPEDRYASAEDLAEDLERFLRGEPIEADRIDLMHRARRWLRREPALASRLGTMAICGAVIQINNVLIGNPGAATKRQIAVVLCWAIASVAFQQILNRERWADLGRYAWGAVDVLLFSLLVLVSRGLNSSLVAGYFLIVSASGLWFRERAVWLTTVLAVAGYAGLAIGQGFAAIPDEAPYRHFVFATALAASGFVVSYQVRRVRALSQYYGQRPLP